MTLLESPNAEYLLLLVFLAFVLTLVAYLVYSGILSSVAPEARAPPFDKIVFAYKTGRGHYKNSGEIFTVASCIAPDKRCMGIYYDDPDAVPENELR